MVTDVIGNGASNRLYKPTGNYVIACNIPTHGICYNALSIIDNKPITWMKNNKWRPKTTVLCLEATRQYARKQNIEGDWMAVYERKDRYNAGLHAVEYSTRHSKEIHLWGFDSMFSQDLTSQMDTLVPRPGRPKLNKWWRPYWQALFLEHSTTKFVIHIPQGENCESYPSNVAICEETMDLVEQNHSQA
mgnify:CR=1 FL=1